MQNKMSRAMKNLLLLARHWLIKKLGGYTEQMIPPMVRYPPSVRLYPERVFAQMRVNNELLDDSRAGWQFFSERAKQELTWALVQEIVKKDYAVLTCEPDWQHGLLESVYTMALCVLPPNDWMKTTLGDFIAPPQEGVIHSAFAKSNRNRL